jgi:hypothetical protein
MIFGWVRTLHASSGTRSDISEMVSVAIVRKKLPRVTSIASDTAKWTTCER